MLDRPKGSASLNWGGNVWRHFFYIFLKNSLFLTNDGPGSGSVDVDEVGKELEALDAGNLPDLAALAAESCSHFF